MRQDMSVTSEDIDASVHESRYGATLKCPMGGAPLGSAAGGDFNISTWIKVRNDSKV